MSSSAQFGRWARRLAANQRPCRWLALVCCLWFAQVAGAAGDEGAAVFMYHRFGEDAYPSTSIRVEQFRAQLRQLEEARHPVVGLAALGAFLDEGQSLPPRTVVLTVDDAYRSVYETGFPLFREAGFTFTVFVCSDPVDAGQPAYMSWEQMREMAAAGVTFANHGAAHLHLTDRLAGETGAAHLERVKRDILKGRRRLAEELPADSLLPGWFAYPYGEYDTAVATWLAEEGVKAFGQQSGAVGASSDTRALPRFPMAEAFADIGEFAVKADSVALPVASIDPWDPVISDPRPLLEITLDPATGIDEVKCFVSGQGQVPVEWLAAGQRFRVGPVRPLGPGHSRVNCTSRRPDGRFYWYSHQWLRP